MNYIFYLTLSFAEDILANRKKNRKIYYVFDMYDIKKIISEITTYITFL